MNGITLHASQDRVFFPVFVLGECYGTTFFFSFTHNTGMRSLRIGGDKYNTCTETHAHTKALTLDGSPV